MDHVVWDSHMILEFLKLWPPEARIQISNDLIRSSLSKNELAFIFRTKIHAIIVFNIYGSEKITFEDYVKI